MAADIAVDIPYDLVGKALALKDQAYEEDIDADMDDDVAAAE